MIALYPTGNSTGSWVCYSLVTGRLVRRSDLKKMVTTDLVITQMNALSLPEVVQQPILFEDEDGKEPQHL